MGLSKKPEAIKQLYVKKVKYHLDYHGTWLPIDNLKLGDIGIMVGNAFRPLGENLSDYGIQYEILPPVPRPDDEFSFSTSGMVIQNYKANVDVDQIGTANLELTFNDSFGIAFRTKEPKISRLAKQGLIAEQIAALYKENKDKWKYRVIIMEMIEVDSASIIISGEAGSSIIVGADVDLDPALANIADAGIGVKNIRKSGAITEYLAKTALTPLYKIGGMFPAWHHMDRVFKWKSDKFDPTKLEGATLKMAFVEDISLEDIENQSED